MYTKAYFRIFVTDSMRDYVPSFNVLVKVCIYSMGKSSGVRRARLSGGDVLIQLKQREEI